MPRIPIIEQTTSVATATPTTQAQGQQVVSPIANAAQVASQGFEQLAQAEVYNQNALFHKENADAVANLSKPMSDAQIYWKQAVVDAQNKTTDGGLIKQDDGTTIGLHGKMQQDFDTWSKTFLDGVTNPKAKQIALEQVSRLRTNVLDTSINIEAQAGVANRSQKVDEAVQGWASQAAGAKDLTQVDQLVLTAKTFIANSGFDEQTRNQKATAAVKAIVAAANQGAMERDPIGYKAAALSRYGVDPTAPPPSAASKTSLPPADEDAINKTATSLGIAPADLRTIISYETAGKFSPSIRGGANNAHVGLIQFGPNEQTQYGVTQQQTFGEQMQAVQRYLKDRGVRPGDDLKTLYKIVNGGNRDVPDTASDGNGTIASHVAKMQAEHSGGGGGSVAAPPAPPINPQLASLVNQLPVEQLPSFISASNTLVNQQQATMKAQVTSTEADHLAAFQTGQPVKAPLTEAQYTAAFGPLEGPQRFANYKSDQQLGNDIASMKAMPPEQMRALAENYHTQMDPDKPGYAVAQKRYETIIRAAQIVDQARQADPIAYAMQTGIGGAKPLEFNDTKAFSAEMNKRQGVAATMQSTYGTPFSLLSKAEASTMQQNFERLTTQQRLGYLDAIKSSLSDPAAYRSVMAQLAPDSPVTAMAGVILSKSDPVVKSNFFSADSVYQPREVAGLILEGEALINPTKASKGEDGKGKVFPMPKEQDLRDQFNSAVGKAFAADPRGADFAYQAVKAYYAGKSARVGDISGNTNSGTLKEAIDAVIGGVSDGGTGKAEVVRPWGMTEARFKDAIAQTFNDAIVANKYNGTNADKLRNFSLRSAGDAKYMLINGTGPLLGADNNPVVLDLTKIHRFSSKPAEPEPLAAPATVVPPKAPTATPKLPGTK